MGDDVLEDFAIVAQLSEDALRELVGVFKQIVAEHSGTEFPQDPREQLDMAVRAVFSSWNTDRAKLYRRRERIPHDLGTAVNICAMVFGNLGPPLSVGMLRCASAIRRRPTPQPAP